MFDLELHNFRSFRDPGPAQIKPLTVIVAENSTGKSSLLAILRIALDMVGGDLKPNFNRDPFFLGAYDQIAHYRGGRGGRRPSFSFTLRTNVKLTRRRDFPSSFPAAYSAEFVKSVSQPSVASIKMSCGDFEVDISEFNTSVPKIKLALPSWKGEVPQRIVDVLPGPPHAYLGTHLFPFLFFHITRLIDEFENIRDPQATRNELEMLSRM
jgi:hypothetical protein